MLMVLIARMNFGKFKVLTCSTLDKMTGKQLFFKAEMFQKTGSFKVSSSSDVYPHLDFHDHCHGQARGALNAIKSCLERGDKVPRVVTHSSGNHGQVNSTI